MEDWKQVAEFPVYDYKNDRVIGTAKILVPPKPFDSAMQIGADRVKKEQDQNGADVFCAMQYTPV